MSNKSKKSLQQERADDDRLNGVKQRAIVQTVGKLSHASDAVYWIVLNR